MTWLLLGIGVMAALTTALIAVLALADRRAERAGLAGPAALDQTQRMELPK